MEIEEKTNANAMNADGKKLGIVLQMYYNRESLF